MYGLLFAILSPLLWALMNVYDKYILVHKIKEPLHYAVLIGIAELAIAIIIGVFLPWDGIVASDLAFPALAGAMLAAQTYLYVFIMKKEDVSHMIGLIYVYPLIVAALSFLFLGERISSQAYIAASLVIIGAIWLSLRARQVRFEVSAWIVGLLIIFVALTEFFAKVATTGLDPWQGFVINDIVFGLLLICALAIPSVRKGFAAELGNIRYALVGESMNSGAILMMYLAMAALPATIVSSLQALQALGVILFERIAHDIYGGLTKDERLLPKLGAILLIVAGVALMYIAL